MPVIQRPSSGGGNADPVDVVQNPCGGATITNPDTSTCTIPALPQHVIEQASTPDVVWDGAGGQQQLALNPVTVTNPVCNGNARVLFSIEADLCLDATPSAFATIELLWNGIGFNTIFELVHGGDDRHMVCLPFRWKNPADARFGPSGGATIGPGGSITSDFGFQLNPDSVNGVLTASVRNITVTGYLLHED